MGLLEYDLEPDELIKDTREYDLIRGSFLGLKYLHGTEKEVDRIAEMLEIAKWPYMVIKGKYGTEKSFRSVQNNPVGTIHVASHAFTKEDIISSKNNSIFSQFHSLKEYLLSNGGLFFAGANNALIGKQLNSSDNDGILLGGDIYKMNLNSIDLVVLSTCSVLKGKQQYDRTWNLNQC